MALFSRKKKVVEDDVVEEPTPTLPEPPAAREDGRRGAYEHREYLLSLVEPLPAFGMQTLDAVGLAVIEDLAADQDIPGVDMALVDGYAVRSGDVRDASAETPVTLPVAARLRLGEQVDGEVPAGVCVQVVAGSPMPEGTSAVVPSAVVEESDDQAAIALSAQPGQYVRAKGSDIAAGETLLRQGDHLTSRLLALLAGAGIDRVMARPRPRVVVLATGAELVEPGRPLKADSDTYDVNSYLLAAAARAEGAHVFRVGAYTKDPAKLRELITDQLIRADLVITTGGVSRDEVDLIQEVLPQLGLTDFTEVAMEPGAVQGFGLIGPDECPFVMLPGNPLVAYVSYQMFVRPLIRRLMGTEPAAPSSITAITQSLVRAEPGTTRLVLGTMEEHLGGRRTVQPLSGTHEHQLGELAQANCLIVLDDDVELVPAGGAVRVVPLDGQ